MLNGLPLAVNICPADMLVSADIATPLDSEIRAIAMLRDRFDAHLAAVLDGGPDGDTDITEAMRYAALAGGKRIRPLALLLLASALDCPTPRVMGAACAVELIHVASLVLDDLPCMDDASMRRHQPALHRRYGEDVAVLVSVALLGKAWQLVAEAGAMGAQQQLEAIAILSRAVGTQGLVQGQYRDIRDGGRARGLPEIISANDQKTGALFFASFEIAMVAADVGDERRRLLRRAARHFAHAFQVRDDLNDCERGSTALGKDAGQDIGKSTCVSLLGMAGAQQMARQHFHQAERALAQALPGDRRLVCLLRESLWPADR